MNVLIVLRKQCLSRYILIQKRDKRRAEIIGAEALVNTTKQEHCT